MTFVAFFNIYEKSPNERVDKPSKPFIHSSHFIDMLSISIVFSTKDGEMYVSFGMRLYVIE